MQQDKILKKYSKKLTQISLNKEGAVDSERATAVLECLRQEPPKGVRKILQHYKNYIAQELGKTHATIEHAGDLEASTVGKIQESLSGRFNRSIQVSSSSNPDLIAGIRVTLADHVWEQSVSNSLKNLLHQEL